MLPGSRSRRTLKLGLALQPASANPILANTSFLPCEQSKLAQISRSYQNNRLFSDNRSKHVLKQCQEEGNAWHCRSHTSFRCCCCCLHPRAFRLLCLLFSSLFSSLSSVLQTLDLWEPIVRTQLSLLSSLLPLSNSYCRPCNHQILAFLRPPSRIRAKPWMVKKPSSFTRGEHVCAT